MPTALARDTPVEWSSDHRLPDHVRFHHAAHLQSGVTCQTCHGAVWKMPRTVKAETLSIGWCLDCRRDPESHQGPADQASARTPAAGPPPHSADHPTGRRDALLMGASIALAAAGYDGPDEHGHPLHARPRRVVAEVASYATVLDLEGLGCGVLVRTRAGHAVKLEGNSQHPASLGATDVFAEAAVLSLHDPERSRRIRRNGAPRLPVELDAALAEARAALLPTGGAGLRLLTGPVASPTLARLIGEVLAAHPGARWHQYDPLADDAVLAGVMAAYGQPVAVLPDLARARTVLCLGADPLGPGPAQLALARGWSVARRAGRAAGRLPG